MIEPTTNILATPVTEQEIKTQRLARRVKAVTSPTRLRILHCLLQSEKAICVSDLGQMLTMHQPTVSHHLRILRDTEIIFPRKQGSVCYYVVHLEALSEALYRLQQYATLYEERNRDQDQVQVLAAALVPLVNEKRQHTAVGSA